MAKYQIFASERGDEVTLIDANGPAHGPVLAFIIGAANQAADAPPGGWVLVERPVFDGPLVKVV